MSEETPAEKLSCPECHAFCLPTKMLDHLCWHVEQGHMTHKDLGGYIQDVAEEHFEGEEA